MATDNVFRGRSLTRGDPSWQAGVGVESDAGLYGGLSASRIDFGPLWDREFELTYEVGFGRDLHADWWAELGLRRYTYPRTSDPLDYDHTEATGVLRFRDLLTLRVAYAPGWSGHTTRGVVRSDRMFAVEAGLQHSLGSGLSIGGGLGRIEVAGEAGGKALYWSAGLAYQRGRLTLDASHYATDHNAAALYGTRRVTGDIVASLVYAF